ncbi:MAG: glycoside hydrolase family 18 protein [Chloroflexota bacterium]|nr:glycoside hydrolase family 18 protein [Chloroflexota bacterium]
MHLRVLSLLTCVLGVLTLVPLAAQESPSDYRVIGYFTSWGIYGRQYFVNEIPADKLTHINYAFVNISETGECILGDEWADTQHVYLGNDAGSPPPGNFNQLNLLKEAYPHLQTLISVGGWTWSGRFSDMALTTESRQRFAASCVDFMLRYGFDGIDLDWEYPTGGGNVGNIERPEDQENFILLLAEFRAQLDAQGSTDGRPYLLTIAAGAGERAYATLDWSRIHPLLDWINVMAYDMSGAWSDLTGFNAPLFDSTANPPEGTSVDTALRAYLALGVPSDKLVMGVAFYGRGWAGVAADGDGLHQSFASLPEGRWSAGTFEYNELTPDMMNSYTRFWDETAQVPWLYNADDGIMITYDDPESLAVKAEYVRENGLGGVMLWELSQDTTESALLSALFDTLSAP